MRNSLFVLLFFLLLLISTEGCRKNDSKVSSNIATLDSLLQHADDFTILQLKKIAELKQKRLHALSPQDLYLYDNLLFENYYTLNADSALSYAEKSIHSAQMAGNDEWVIHSRINKASVLAATGLLKQALDVMDSIDSSTLSREQLVEYYGQMIYLFSHLGNYAGANGNDYYITERLYKDSIINVIEPSHPEYLWYKGWDILGTNQGVDSVIDAYAMKLAKSNLDSRQDAKDAYLLARLYEQKGDMKNFENYMVLSAIIDVKIANYEIASLEDLASYMFNNGNGDIDRAYNYINYTLDKALHYPNRTRAFGISNTLERINQAYQERIQSQQHHTKVFLVLVCILAAILIIAVIAIIWQNKKVVRQRMEVNEANENLNQKVLALSEAEEKLNRMNQLLQNLNNDLKSKNAELFEANFVKEEYLGYVFNLYSSYIAKIEDFKRNIYLRAVKKQLKEIEKETSEIDIKDELKDFYHSFDTIFLNIYPNFVSDFNKLLKPDKQVTLKEGELLNTELRIYALIRLGINDSVKIADFLHCAPQTVYNYRLRTRTRSLYPKNEFLDKVKSLGSFIGKD